MDRSRVFEPGRIAHGAAALGLAATLSVAILVSPSLALVLGLGLLFAAGGWIVLETRPRLVLGLSPLLVLLSWTKFRLRSVGATLAGQVDTQIIVELVLHAALAVIVVRLGSRFLRSGFRPSVPEWGVVGYGVLALLSVAWSPTPALTLVRSVQLLVVVGVAITMVRVFGPGETFRWLGRSIVVYVALLWPLSLVLPETFHAPFDDRPGYAWFAMHPGSLATIAGTGLVILLGNAGKMLDRRQKGLNPVVIGVALAFCALLYFARSRTHMAGALMGLVLIPMFRSRYRAVVPLAAVALVGLVLVFQSPGSVSVGSMLEAGATSESPVLQYLYRGQSARSMASLTGRMEVWRDVVDLMMGDKLLLGYGYASYRSVLIDRAHWATDPHNATLQSLLNLGLLGAVLVHGLVLQSFLSLLPRYHRTADQRHELSLLLALGWFVVLTSIVGGGFAGHGYPVFLFLLVAVSAGVLRQSAAPVPRPASPRRPRRFTHPTRALESPS